MEKMDRNTRKLTQILKVAKKPKPIEEFNYVVKRQEQAKICFGSGIERQLLPLGTKGLVSKHAATNIYENIKTISPGMYGTPQQTTAMYKLMTKPTSTYGTVLGGRTVPILKQVATTNMFTPAPCTYDPPTTFPTTFKQNNVPFNVGDIRRVPRGPNTPGIGLYKVEPYKHRAIPFHYSFGGRRTLLPAVEMKCGPFNFDTCERCHQFPVGDYWSMNLTEAKKPKTKKKDPTEYVPDGIFLCRDCYEFERRNSVMFKKMQIRAFHKARTCSTVHSHDGCIAKLFLVPPHDIEKMQEREAYLALYFP